MATLQPTCYQSGKLLLGCASFQQNEASLQHITRNQEIHVKQIRKVLEMVAEWTEIVG
jgi:hypothetical protein